MKLVKQVLRTFEGLRFFNFPARFAKLHLALYEKRFIGLQFSSLIFRILLCFYPSLFLLITVSYIR